MWMIHLIKYHLDQIHNVISEQGSSRRFLLSGVLRRKFGLCWASLYRKKASSARCLLLKVQCTLLYLHLNLSVWLENREREREKSGSAVIKLVPALMGFLAINKNNKDNFTCYTTSHVELHKHKACLFLTANCFYKCKDELKFYHAAFDTLMLSIRFDQNKAIY